MVDDMKFARYPIAMDCYSILESLGLKMAGLCSAAIWENKGIAFPVGSGLFLS